MDWILQNLTTGYVFPNDMHVHWSLMIVLYPYLTGIVAGAFIVSSLYHVFGVRSLQPVARFSLLLALAYLACATVPLLVHLGRPVRAMSMFVTPNPSSAMSGFAYFYVVYGVVLLLEIFFLYRPLLAGRAARRTGLKRVGYRVLAMASDNLSERALAFDRRAVQVLAAMGIPLACVLHGYVGFIFGGIKANPMWATPLMPVIFLLSAAVSGMAAVLLAYVLLAALGRRSVDADCLRTGLRYLWGFFTVTIALELLEVVTQGYMATGHWQALRALLWGPLFESYWIWQVLVLSCGPWLLLAYLCLGRPRRALLVGLSGPVAALVLAQVLLMRWNVIIGGQLASKSGLGSVYFQPGWLEREGILISIGILVLPLLILRLLGSVFPLWGRPAVPGGDSGFVINPVPENEQAGGSA